MLKWIDDTTLHEGEAEAWTDDNDDGKAAVIPEWTPPQLSWHMRERAALVLMQPAVIRCRTEKIAAWRHWEHFGDSYAVQSGFLGTVFARLTWRRRMRVVVARARAFEEE